MLNAVRPGSWSGYRVTSRRNTARPPSRRHGACVFDLASPLKCNIIYSSAPTPNDTFCRMQSQFAFFLAFVALAVSRENMASSQKYYLAQSLPIDSLSLTARQRLRPTSLAEYTTIFSNLAGTSDVKATRKTFSDGNLRRIPKLSRTKELEYVQLFEVSSSFESAYSRIKPQSPSMYLIRTDSQKVP